MAQTSVLYVRIPSATHKVLVKAADDHCTSLTQLVTRAVEAYLSEKLDYPVESARLP